MQVIDQNPGIRIKDITLLIGKTSSNISKLIQPLQHKGLIRREGSTRTSSFYHTGREYKLASDDDELPKQPRDKLIEEAQRLQLTEDQKSFLNQHMHLPRRQLAQKLEISKVALNLYLDSLKTKTNIRKGQ
jgi:biotin operon repressor